jgi:hypothetical protein
MEHALVLRGKCVRANMRWNLGQTVPARAGDPTADKYLLNFLQQLYDQFKPVFEQLFSSTVFASWVPRQAGPWKRVGCSGDTYVYRDKRCSGDVEDEELDGAER